MVQNKPEAPGAVTPQKKIELFSGTYFAACTLGGIIGK
jgi:solute carrier family 25 phosphate transporter 3